MPPKAPSSPPLLIVRFGPVWVAYLRFLHGMRPNVLLHAAFAFERLAAPHTRVGSFR